MRRRLLLVLLPLLAALLAALMVPLAQTYAARETQDLYIKHVGFAQRFAALAEPVLVDNRERAVLEHQLRAYADVTPGVTVSVFNNNRELLQVDHNQPSAAAVAAGDRFLVDRTPGRLETAWPWRTTPMIVGEPVGRRGPQIGAVVLEVPTHTVRDRVLLRIAVLAGAGLGVLLLTVGLCALPLTRWVLRPVHDLNATAGRLAGGGLGARASERDGPPELRGLARAFNEMADNLVAALQRQRAFVADASHELRNPLATLRLRIEALAGKVHGDGERDLRLALSESDRLAGVVDRLLELARAEATAAEQVEFDVVAVTQERLAAWAPALQAVGSVPHLDAPAQAISRSSPEALRYALDVLLDNASKFAPGTLIDVVVRRSDGDHVEVTVRDYGSGLAGTDVAHVAERFWRSAQHRGIPGTGLGLATARALLESAGATIAVSVADPGLAVVVRLPATTGAAVDTSVPRQDADAPGTWRSPPAR